MNEIIFSDLAQLCKPSSNISDKRIINKWCSYEYETDEIFGSMLIAPMYSKPQDITLYPELNGWYKIYVGLFGGYRRNCMIDLKLSDDKAFRHLGNSITEIQYGEHFIEDVFWRCADMTGQNVIIGKHLSAACMMDSTLSWIRFVPMTDEEIEDYLNDKKRKDVKRLYTTNDMQCMLVAYDMSDENQWFNVIDEVLDSDAEWMSFESFLCYKGDILETSLEDFAFADDYEKKGVVYKGIKSKQNDIEFYKQLVNYGQENGLNIAISLRVCMWGMEYPYDRVYFDGSFMHNNPQFRCVDRDGDITDYMSFAYKEVQDYVIDMFVKIAQTGCNAVQPIFTRGWPYILFEEPFIKRFTEKYGEDPRTLPLDDERIITVKCEIMTEFMRRLRNCLDEVRKENRVEIHAKVLFSVYDNKVVGIDLESWAKEGLVDRIVSDERRIREVLNDSVWEDDSHNKIDINKYTKFARKSSEPIIRYDYDYIFKPLEDSKGILKGPSSQEERISEFMLLERKYGIIVYIEIMPREMDTEEIKNKAKEIYNCGCEHIGLWDTYSRVVRKREWTMWRRIGHKNELESFNDNGMFKKVRLLKLGGKNLRSYEGMWSG